MKPEPVLDLQGPRRVPTPQGPAPSPRRAAPIQQKCLQQLDFAPPTSEGFSSGKERVLIPALPHLPPPPMPLGWPCKMLNAHSAPRHRVAQVETQIFSMPVCTPSSPSGKVLQFSLGGMVTTTKLEGPDWLSNWGHWENHAPGVQTPGLENSIIMGGWKYFLSW